MSLALEPERNWLKVERADLVNREIARELMPIFSPDPDVRESSDTRLRDYDGITLESKPKDKEMVVDINGIKPSVILPGAFEFKIGSANVRTNSTLTEWEQLIKEVP